MATELEKERWNLHLEKYKKLFNYGFNNGLIRTYDKELLDKLDNYYFGGMPLSIVLLCNRACNGFCYDRAMYIALALEDSDGYTMVDADVDSIRLNPMYIDENRNKDNPHYANHCFIVTKDKDGKEIVYDTSVGLVFDKDLYFEMEKPVVTSMMDKNVVMRMQDYRDFKNSDLEIEKYALPLIMPSYEALAMVGQPYYTDELKRRLEEFKSRINYDSLKEEVDEDMRVMGLSPGNKKKCL